MREKVITLTQNKFHYQKNSYRYWFTKIFTFIFIILLINVLFSLVLIEPQSTKGYFILGTRIILWTLFIHLLVYVTEKAYEKIKSIDEKEVNTKSNLGWQSFFTILNYIPIFLLSIVILFSVFIYPLIPKF